MTILMIAVVVVVWQLSLRLMKWALFSFYLLGLTHWIWINSGGCNVDATFFKNMGIALRSARNSCKSLNSMKIKVKEPWRIKILENLQQRNENEIERYKTFEGANETEVRLTS